MKYVADYELLVHLALVAFIALLTALVGLARALLNSRRVLAAYAFVLWSTLSTILSLAHPAYKRYTVLEPLARWERVQHPAQASCTTGRTRLACCAFLGAAPDASVPAYPRRHSRGTKTLLSSKGPFIDLF